MNPSIPRHRGNRSRASRRTIPLLAALGAAALSGHADSPQGLTLRLEGGGTRDWLVVSNVALRVEPRATPSPFLPAGPFSAEWSGTVSVDLRGDYQFQAEHAGRFRLEINGTNVLSSVGDGPSTDWSPFVRLRKGTNHLRAILERPSSGETQVRLRWQGRGVSPGPIPTSALSPDPAPDPTEAELSARRRTGRELFLVHQCGRCHDPEVANGASELSMEGPSFDGIGNRRGTAWLARWIAQPRSLRPEATMPRVFRGASAEGEARAVAAWLSSLRDTNAPATSTGPGGHAAIGRSLFEALQCSACHVLPDRPDEPGKVSLRSVGEQFADGALVPFLQRPGQHYPWIPMPDFALGADEAGHLAAALLAAAPKASDAGPPATPDDIERGRVLAESRGCLQCHSGPVQSRLRARPLRELPPSSWHKGCLATTSDRVGSAAPDFGFGPDELAALRAFGASDRRSLEREVPTDYAERWSRRLRCDACHGSIEGVPSIRHAGEKLRPEWTRRFLEGAVPYKPRPWLQARMPAYARHANGLAAGLAAIHGLPPQSPIEPPIDPVAASDGRKMVSASGGFACVSCHAVGPLGATAVFEAPGINLIRSGERLLPDYFARWVRNPQAVDPGTKMPLYFDEDGNSALTDFYGGDGPKTIHALWNYLRLGDGMQPPEP